MGGIYGLFVRRGTFIAFLGTVGPTLGTGSLAAQVWIDGGAPDLRRCVGITSDLRRLACFDSLAAGIRPAMDSSARLDTARTMTGVPDTITIVSGPDTSRLVRARPDSVTVRPDSNKSVIARPDIRVDSAAPPAVRAEPVPLAGRRIAGGWMLQERTNPLDDSKVVILSLEAASGGTPQGRKPILSARCSSGMVEVYIDWFEDLGPDAYITQRVGNASSVRKRWSLSTDRMSSFYPGDASPFLADLTQVDRFIAQVTPKNQSPVTAQFNVSRMADALKPLRAACPPVPPSAPGRR